MSKKLEKNIKYYLFLWILNTSRFFLKKFRNIAHYSYKKIDWKSLKKINLIQIQKLKNGQN